MGGMIKFRQYNDGNYINTVSLLTKFIFRPKRTADNFPD
jgi:hypothetical protein